MTLIVENGTGLSNAESYTSVAYADAYSQLAITAHGLAQTQKKKRKPIN